MAKPHDSLTTILFALIANGLIAVAKGVAAWITGSTSMLAEAAHSLADCGNQGLLLWGMRVAARPASADYPLGHGRVIYFWSFIVALMLFSMGGMFSIYERLHKIDSGEPLESPWMAVGVLVFSLAAESVSLWKAMAQVNSVRGSQSLWRWLRDTRQSELLVVVGEDIAATAGLAFALLAVAAAMVTGNPVYDAIGSLAIGVLLLGVAVFVGLEVKALLVGQKHRAGPARGHAALSECARRDCRGAEPDRAAERRQRGGGRQGAHARASVGAGPDSRHQHLRTRPARPVSRGALVVF